VSHVITLTGVVHEASSGKLTGFYIADSGRGRINVITCTTI
jgi:hypothetical protein